MTTTTRNEAAERLRSFFLERGWSIHLPRDYSGLDPFPVLADEAFAAERRATVERIRERLWSSDVGEMVMPGALDYHWFAADDIADVLSEVAGDD